MSKQGATNDKKCKKDYLLSKTECYKNDSKKLWNCLKTLGYQRNCKTSKQPIVLNIENKICFDPVVIADYVNCFFINIAHKLVSALPVVDDLFSAFTENCRKFYSNLGATPGLFKLNEVSAPVIYQELRNLNVSKSTGLDQIGPRFLQDGADSLCGIITHLINTSIKSKIVPDCTKIAKVHPLHKKKQQT